MSYSAVAVTTGVPIHRTSAIWQYGISEKILTGSPPRDAQNPFEYWLFISVSAFLPKWNIRERCDMTSIQSKSVYLLVSYVRLSLFTVAAGALTVAIWKISGFLSWQAKKTKAYNSTKALPMNSGSLSTFFGWLPLLVCRQLARGCFYSGWDRYIATG